MAKATTASDSSVQFTDNEALMVWALTNAELKLSGQQIDIVASIRGKLSPIVEPLFKKIQAEQAAKK